MYFINFRSYWHCFSDDTKAIVYVVDAADRARLGLTKRELHALLEADEFRNAKLLVLANKQDLAGAASSAEVSEALALSTLRDRSWTIVPTIATEGKGIDEGMDWYVPIFSPKWAATNFPSRCARHRLASAMQTQP